MLEELFNEKQLEKYSAEKKLAVEQMRSVKSQTLTQHKKETEKQLEKEMIGTAGQKRVPAKSIIDYQILIPTLIEQTRIAHILSDMDVEIEALERQLAKYRLIKQGMMQNLLTGRIRLV